MDEMKLSEGDGDPSPLTIEKVVRSVKRGEMCGKSGTMIRPACIFSQWRETTASYMKMDETVPQGTKLNLPEISDRESVYVGCMLPNLHPFKFMM